MSGVDAYLAQVARKLAGMDRAVREDILRELRSHIVDAAAESGGEAAVLASIEPPEKVASRYKAIYGYGFGFRALFVAIAALLAVPTLPILLYTGTGTALAFSATLLALLLLVGYLMAVAVKAGAIVGLAAGVAAAASRFVSLGAFGATAGAVVPDGNGLVMFVAISAILVLIGYLPGRARERWQKTDVTM